MRDQIISEIRRIADTNGGQAPGQTLFARETGIAAHIWLGKFWARWGDALVEAGFQANEWTARRNSDQILEAIIEGVRHFGRMPTRNELMLYRQNNPSIPPDNTIKRHFGRRNDLIAALVRRVSENPAYADILPLLPPVTPKTAEPLTPSKPDEGFVYLIKSGEFYKVGRSDDIERRIKEIRVALPDKAALIHSIKTDDPPGIEAYWHRRFADRRANGEWFRLTPQDVAAFRKRKFQ